MTTALCLHCGNTKLGAFCLCPSCGAEATGNHALDILFSDHRMHVETLRRFGEVVKQLNEHCDDHDIRFWAFIGYLSHHPADLLSAEPPPEIADDVALLLGRVELPLVEVGLKELPEDEGPPSQEVVLPPSLYRAYLRVNPKQIIDGVQLRLRSGETIRGALMLQDGAPTVLFQSERDVAPEDIAAIRQSPGCLLGWLFPPRWIHAELG